MFITLRSSSGGRAKAAGTELEQVTRRNAAGGPRVTKDGIRPARRPACVACQTKKLRCTGRGPRACDRCRARLIDCASPARNGQDKHRTDSPPSVQPGSPSKRTWQEVGDASPQPADPSHDPPASQGGNGASLGSSKPPQPTTTAPRASVDDDAPDGDLFDSGFTLMDPADQAWSTGPTTTTTANLIDGFDMDTDYPGRDAGPVEVPSSTGSVTGKSNHAHQPNKSLQDSFPQGQLRPTPDTAAQESCSCLTDLVRVVQQLDDDEFHLTTMSLDQVLQLQKWLIFQCCKPLDCPSCLDLSATHTMRLIICDRLTEMFECIHLRVKRGGAMLVGQSSDSSSSQPMSSPPDSVSTQSESQSQSSFHYRGPLFQQQSEALFPAAGSGPLPSQLFCGSSGRAASKADCNPLMFSDAFRNQYSDEEQVHMIRVLLRLQSRNFHKLLLRVERTSQVAASQARRAKVESMMARLAKASADIENAWRAVFRGLTIQEWAL